MKDTFYFSHDYNARQDSKVKKLLAKHGLLGYGIFWSLIEDLYNNANALPTDYDSIAYDLRTDKNVIKDIIENYELFVINQNLFGSTSVQRRLEERNEKSANARQSAIKRWEKMRTQSEVNANALPTDSEGNAIKERKGKEMKEYIYRFNSVVKKSFRGDSKTERQFNARISEGFTIDEMITALEAAKTDNYHIETNGKYLTPEFFTRADKIEKFLNAKPVVTSEKYNIPKPNMTGTND